MKVNLIPLAGQGQRFINEGYKVPKPLIKVSGFPMIIQAARSLPAADFWVFLCREEHVKKYSLDKVLKKFYPKSKIVVVKKLTEGQASTCLLGEKFVDPEAQLTIGACDNGMVYNPQKFEKAMDNKNTDAIAWTFSNNPTLERNPKAWGWVAFDSASTKLGKNTSTRLSTSNLVQKVSVKIPISDDPIHDQAIVGTFSFKKAKHFFENAKLMIKQNLRINNEFYVDELMNVLVEQKFKVKHFEIDKYIGWGTPNDLRVYEYWEKYFKLKKNGLV